MIDFLQLRWDAGFTRKTLSEYLGVSRQTVRNWEKSNNPPVSVVKLMQLLSNDLSHLGDEWTGFRFYNGELMSPEKDFIRAGQIRAFPYLEQSNQFRSKEITRLKTKLDSSRALLGIYSIAK